MKDELRKLIPKVPMSPILENGEKLNLKLLPKFISYKAALLRERAQLQYVILVLSVLFLFVFVIDRIEIYSLYQRLRQKEYILAPGVMDFTTAFPQNVSDKYVGDAVSDYLGRLGNVNAQNVEENFRYLTANMVPEFRVRFEAETKEWIEKIKNDNISQVLKILTKEIQSDGKGFYKIKVVGRQDTYISNQFVDSGDVVIVIVLNLVPPEQQKRWFLQISSLQQSKKDIFNLKESWEKN